jgi:hypothetical protein
VVVDLWERRYDALAKMRTRRRREHRDLRRKLKQQRVKACSAEEAIERQERFEREIKSKDSELAVMVPAS